MHLDLLAGLDRLRVLEPDVVACLPAAPARRRPASQQAAATASRRRRRRGGSASLRVTSLRFSVGDANAPGSVINNVRWSAAADASSRGAGRPAALTG